MEISKALLKIDLIEKYSKWCAKRVKPLIQKVEGQVYVLESQRNPGADSQRIEKLKDTVQYLKDTLRGFQVVPAFCEGKRNELEVINSDDDLKYFIVIIDEAVEAIAQSMGGLEMVRMNISDIQRERRNTKNGKND